jgi:hypothetical protein
LVPPPNWAKPFYRNNFHKLRALSLTQFDSVVVLDSDVTLTRNIDHLALAPAPAAACQPRRGFRMCSFNFGVHVLRPSAVDAERLLRTYSIRQTPNNGGEQEVWSNFHKSIYELPLGVNAHQGLSMAPNDWKWTSALHHMRGITINRIPPTVTVGGGAKRHRKVLRDGTLGITKPISRLLARGE